MDNFSIVDLIAFGVLGEIIVQLIISRLTKREILFLFLIIILNVPLIVTGSIIIWIRALSFSIGIIGIGIGCIFTWLIKTSKIRHYALLITSLLVLQGMTIVVFAYDIVFVVHTIYHYYFIPLVFVFNSILLAIVIWKSGKPDSRCVPFQNYEFWMHSLPECRYCGHENHIKLCHHIVNCPNCDHTSDHSKKCQVMISKSTGKTRTTHKYVPITETYQVEEDVQKFREETVTVTENVETYRNILKTRTVNRYVTNRIPTTEYYTEFERIQRPYSVWNSDGVLTTAYSDDSVPVSKERIVYVERQDTYPETETYFEKEYYNVLQPVQKINKIPYYVKEMVTKSRTIGSRDITSEEQIFENVPCGCNCKNAYCQCMTKRTWYGGHKKIQLSEKTALIL